MIGGPGSGRHGREEDASLLERLRAAVTRREGKDVEAAKERARGLARLRREDQDGQGGK